MRIYCFVFCYWCSYLCSLLGFLSLCEGDPVDAFFPSLSPPLSLRLDVCGCVWMGGG